jgi:hypothetical protein
MIQFPFPIQPVEWGRRICGQTIRAMMRATAPNRQRHSQPASAEERLQNSAR